MQTPTLVEINIKMNNLLRLEQRCNAELAKRALNGALSPKQSIKATNAIMPVHSPYMLLCTFHIQLRNISSRLHRWTFFYYFTHLHSLGNNTAQGLRCSSFGVSSSPLAARSVVHKCVGLNT